MILVEDRKDGGWERGVIRWKRKEPLPVVRALDVAWDGTAGYQLLLGFGSNAHAELRRVDSELRERVKQVNRFLGRRVLAVHFDDACAPLYAAITDQDGFIWGFDLENGSGLKHLVWTYRLDGPVHTIGSLKIVRSKGERDQRHFVAASLSGKVVLLRAHSGRRLWKHRAPDALCSLAVGSSDGKHCLLAVGGINGDTSLFELLADQERHEALKEVRMFLDRPLDETLSQQWVLPGASRRLVGALRDLCLEKRPTQSWNELIAREPRSQIVRYLAKDPDQLFSEPGGEFFQATAGTLNWRELAILLSQLKDENIAWDVAVGDIFRKRDNAQGSGDGSRSAQVHAMVVYLQRLARKGMTATQLMAHRPNDKLMADEWVRLEFARALLHSTQGSAGANPQELPPHEVIRLVSNLPPAMIWSFATVCGDSTHPLHSLLRALADVIEALSQKINVPVQALETLSDCLSFFDGMEAEPAVLIGALARLVMLGSDKEEPWHERRGETLEFFRQLGEVAHQDDVGTPLGRQLRLVLRRRIPKMLPPDSSPLKERLAWFLEANGRQSKKPGAVKASSDSDAGQQWTLIVNEIERLLVKQLRTISSLEIQHCNTLVRPHLKQTRAVWREAREVEIELTLEPEGERTLEHAFIQISATGENGLAPVGKDQRTISWELPSFSKRSLLGTVKLSGGLRPALRTIDLQVKIRDALSYLLEERWSINAPAPRPAPSDGPFPAALPTACNRLLEELCGKKSSGLHLVALDAELGRAGFIHEARERYQAHTIELDTLLWDYGPGRKYDDLTMERILGTLGAQGQQDRPTLVTPADELFKRLLHGERNNVLPELFEKLSVLKTARPIAFIVSSSTFFALLPSVSRTLKLTVAHLLREPDERAEAVRWLDEGRTELWNSNRAVEEFEGDLRLVLRYRKLQDQMVTPEEFILEKDVRKLLLDDLGRLSPSDLLLVLLGALAETQLSSAQLEVGHVPAMDALSHPKPGRPRKALIEVGRPLTRDVINNLKADGRYGQVSVEGFDGAVTGRAAVLAEIAHRQGDEQARESVRRRLSTIGLGDSVRSVFRTKTPYRHVLQQLEREVNDGKPVPGRDERLLRSVVASELSLLEWLKLQDLPALSNDVFKSILPLLSESDRSTLRDIAKPYSADIVKSISRHRIGALFGQEASELAGNEDRADKLMRELSGPGRAVFGLGVQIQEDWYEQYAIWLDAPWPEALSSARNALAALRKHKPAVSSARVAILGPGADVLPDDQTREVAVLQGRELLLAARSTRLSDGIRERVRAKLRLTTLSPFITSGALSPGSSLFVGREEELAYVRDHLRSGSILLVGGRQMGKTSLLNQVLHWARSQPDLDPLFVDCAGIHRGDEFDGVQIFLNGPLRA